MEDNLKRGENIEAQRDDSDDDVDMELVQCDGNVDNNTDTSCGEQRNEDDDNVDMVLAQPAGESTATFEPVIQLDEVEVTTGEESEEMIYSQHCKLFVYGETMLDAGTGTKTWKERGIGNVSLMKHKESGKISVLMRQEQTMKIVINHIAHQDLHLEPNRGSDRSWVWMAFDFAEGELLETVFAVRFANSELATLFKETFEGAKAEMEALNSRADAVSAESKEADETLGNDTGTNVMGKSNCEGDTDNDMDPAWLRHKMGCNIRRPPPAVVSLWAARRGKSNVTLWPTEPQASIWTPSEGSPFQYVSSRPPTWQQTLAPIPPVGGPYDSPAPAIGGPYDSSSAPSSPQSTPVLSLEDMSSEDRPCSKRSTLKDLDACLLEAMVAPSQTSLVALSQCIR
jgi:Ran-binding protein 1